jgi:ABC-2 type transport system ATP-binding protein
VDLTRRFGELTALDRLNIEVAGGEIFGLVGPDGAGKTTTLRLLSNLLDSSMGEAWVAGFNVARNPDAVRDRIGYLAQRFGLYPDLTVDENMIFYADLFGIAKQERERLLPRLLEMTRMAPFVKRQAGRLSGGMKQKLALMCTLLHHPQILLLDEPTNGVDPVSRRDFWQILTELVKDGLTVLVTTAYLDEAERCDRVGLLHQGKLIRCDTPEALKRGMEESCYEILCEDPRGVRERLARNEEVLSVAPAGAKLHMFLMPGASLEAVQKQIGACAVREIVPSLEDVFIGMIRKVSR